MSQLFKTIGHVPLNNNFVGNLNQQLTNIDDNFRKLLSLPLVKGDKGDGVGVLELDTCVEMDGYHYFTTLGRAIIMEIYKIYSEVNQARILAAINPEADDSPLDNFVELGYTPRGTLEALQMVLTEIELNDQNFEAISIGNEFNTNPENTYPDDPDTSNDLIIYGNNLESSLNRIKIYYQRSSEEVTQQETTTYFNGVSVGYVFHFDGRLQDIPNYENELAVNFIDTSCALMITNVTGHFDINNINDETFTVDPDNVTVTRCSIIPTLYFDGDDTPSHAHTNTFCWMINDRRTGITAQGIKGDPGNNAFAYICSGILDTNHTKISIDSVLSPMGENNTPIQSTDIPNGSIAFVWFQHNDGIPTDEDYDPVNDTEIDYPISVINDDTQQIQIGTERFRALDLAVGIVQYNGTQKYIDYNTYYTSSVYLSLANIFQSCVLYNEMLRLNKYPYVARGLFVPDNSVNYSETYSQSNQPQYHLFGSFKNPNNRTKYAYIGMSPLSEILKKDNTDRMYTDIYPNYTGFQAEAGTLKSLYDNFIMHNFKITRHRDSSASIFNLSVLPDEDGGTLYQPQVSVVLGDYAYQGTSSEPTAQAAITMFSNNREITDTGVTNNVPHWWGTNNIARLTLHHGDFSCYSDPNLNSNPNNQNFLVYNPYVRFQAETGKYVLAGVTDISKWRSMYISGYKTYLYNTPKIEIKGIPGLHDSGGGQNYWVGASTKIQPRITIEGDASLSSTDISNYIHINQMKCRFDVTDMSEDHDYERVVEIIRNGENYINTSTSNYSGTTGTPGTLPKSTRQSVLNSENDLDPSASASPTRNSNFNNFTHYKLGFQCTRTSALLLGDKSNNNATILQVKYGTVRFDDNLYVGALQTGTNFKYMISADNPNKTVMIGAETTNNGTYGNGTVSWATMGAGDADACTLITTQRNMMYITGKNPNPNNAVPTGIRIANINTPNTSSSDSPTANEDGNVYGDWIAFDGAIPGNTNQYNNIKIHAGTGSSIMLSTRKPNTTQTQTGIKINDGIIIRNNTLQNISDGAVALGIKIYAYLSINGGQHTWYSCGLYTHYDNNNSNVIYASPWEEEAPPF